MRKFFWLTMVMVSLWASASLLAETPEAPVPKVNHLKIAASMLSDAQNWTDRRIVDSYRLQHRPGSESWRVLGPSEKVLFKGTREASTKRLDRLLDGKQPAQEKGDVVVLVHGLFQTRTKMETLAVHLQKTGGFQVINFGYASTKADIAAHSAALEEVLGSLAPETNVSFVGHSMGCIVIRSLLTSPEKKSWKAGRVVMLAPPNQGAEMARRFASSRIVTNLLGPGFEQLADPKLDDLSSFKAPSCEFSVIAGASPKWLLNNPLIAGEDDWIVGLKETHLPGAKSQTCVDAHHGNIVHDPQVLTYTCNFLLRGEFDPPSPKQGK